jgi:hypothetical protein
LAKLSGRTIQTVSTHLAKLRAMDVVRYDTAGKEVRYWLKHKPEMKTLLKGASERNRGLRGVKVNLIISTFREFLKRGSHLLSSIFTRRLWIRKQSRLMIVTAKGMKAAATDLILMF